MAKDILITPADGTLVFSGSASSLSSSFISDASGSLTLYLEKTGNQSFGIEGSGSTLLKVDGTQGRLFSITDEVSGSIFSANTIAGLSVIEAFSDNEVRFGPYSSPVIVDSSGNISGSATSTGSFGRVEATTLTINGNVTFSNNLDVQGSFKLNQSSVTATTTTTLDLTSSVNFKISLGTNTTLAISNASSAIGQSGVIVFVQDTTGGRSVTIPSSWKTPRGASISWDTGANSINIISYYVIDGSTIVINYMGDFS